MDTGKHIIEFQNKDVSIRKIAAHKKVYSIAKGIFYSQTIIATVIPIIIAVIPTLFPESTASFIWVFISYTILASIVELVLDRIVINLKETAASIQEELDCLVLNIPWNDVLVTERVSPEIVFSYYGKYKNKESVQKLYDWYSTEISVLKSNIATVVCQRTNCNYDFSIRGKYNTGLGVFVILNFLILLAIATSTGLSMQKFITNVLAPCLPIFLLAVKQYLSNCDSIKNLRDLKTLVENILDNASFNTMVSIDSIRQIQDKIYYNRILSPLLPDWVFYKYRSKLEAQMHFGVRQIIEDIQSRN